MSDPQEASARAIFAIAIRDNRCAELLNHLFEGGGVTLYQKDDGDFGIHLIYLDEIKRLAAEAAGE